MAKRKHAAALFEVFHDKKSAPSRPSLAARGAGWFKGLATDSAPASDVDVNDPTTRAIRSPLLAPRIAAVEATPPAVKQTPAPPPEPAPAPAPRGIETTRSPRTAAGLAVPESLAESDLRRRVRELEGDSAGDVFHFDHAARLLTLRLPLKIAVATGFALLICIGAAYVLGRRTGASVAWVEADARAAALDAQRQVALQPTALDVPRRSARASTPSTSARATPRPVIRDDLAADGDASPAANSIHGVRPVARPDQSDVDRIIGLNYIIVQNYPNQASAAEARDFLAQNGIACTIEKVPDGFFCPDPAWRSVITSRGFEKIHALEYDDFKHDLERLGEKFAGSGKFKRFSLQPYKLK